MWPGVIPDLPAVVSYPIAVDQPPVPGEPAEAVRLRRAMPQTVIDGGWAPSQRVRDALRTVPRHRFAPEANLATAYDGGDQAVVTRRDETGTAISSVSAAWLQADMIESLRLRPGAIVFTVIGCVSMLRLTGRHPDGSSVFLLLAPAVAALFYALIAFVGARPELADNVGLKPIPTEAVLLILLVVLGHGRTADCGRSCCRAGTEAPA
ncbi:hypothetical protein [Streptomyces sp. NPDC052015]|uniref:hypothetical protein n=1 Tax=Streptomyces sp. NPDC052015 TaxID=3154755 RepID=UPI00342A81C8